MSSNTEKALPPVGLKGLPESGKNRLQGSGRKHMAEKGAGGLKPNLAAIQPSSLCGAALANPSRGQGQRSLLMKIFSLLGHRHVEREENPLEGASGHQPVHQSLVKKHFPSLNIQITATLSLCFSKLIFSPQPLKREPAPNFYWSYINPGPCCLRLLAGYVLLNYICYF